MDDVLVAEIELLAHGLDGIDVADEVGDGHVGGGELLLVAARAVDPGDGGVVAEALDERARMLRDGGKRIVVDGRSLDDGHPFVEEADEAADEAGLGLAAQPEQQEIVLREDRVGDLGNDRLVVADDAREQRFLGPELGHEVAPHLLLHRGGTIG